LTRIASSLSGLQAHRRVTVVMRSAAGMRSEALRLLDRGYPADQQAYDETVYRALGLLQPDVPLRPALLARATINVLALYDPLSRNLYVRSGSTDRRALVRELVRALEDQAFDLRRLSTLRAGNRDAAAAAAGAVDGNAEFATTVIGGRLLAISPAPRFTAPGGRPMDVFLQLEQEFPITTGLRFITTLHNLGGNKAVFSALRLLPTTTKQIFHIDSFLAREPAQPVTLPAGAGGLNLQRSDTFGELDVRALLATFDVPRLDQVGEGWGGGRSAIYRDPSGATAVVFALGWGTDLDAARWEEAVTTYVNEAFDPDVPGFPATTPCGDDTCWSIAGRQIAFRRHGASTALVFGPSLAAADALARAAAP
jgi:hypothetical protein